VQENKLKELAKDVHIEKVFVSDYIDKKDSHLLRIIFMPVAFLNENQFEKIKNARLLYSYYKDSIGTSINGYPTFTSFGYLSSEEYEIVFKYLKKYQAAMDSV